MRMDKVLTIREDDQSKRRKAIKVQLEDNENADGLTKKTEEEEGIGKRLRIVRATTCERSGEEPSTRNPENSAVGPVRPRETEEMEDDIEESWHDASEDGWETAYEEVEDGAAKKRKEMRVGAGGSKIGSQPVPGPNRTAFRFGWRAIRIWIVRQGRCSA